MDKAVFLKTNTILNHTWLESYQQWSNAALDVTVHTIEAGWLRIINNETEEICKKKKYINFRDHRNSAIDIVADTSSPLVTDMDGKPISGRGYRSSFSCFLLNVQCPNEIN